MQYMLSLIKNTRKPDIKFYRDGRIFITARVSRILGLSPGDAINIALLDGEYLLFALSETIGRHHARCHPTKKGSHNFCANSTRLARALLDSCGIADQKASFMIGVPIILDEKTYCPIITRKPISNTEI